MERKMILGLDYLGGAKYKDLILREHPDGWAAGFFAQAFGDALPTVDALLATGRCPLVRVHLLWSDTHSFGDKDIAAITKEAKRYEVIAKKYPNVKVELSPFCEHSIRNPDKYLDIVKANAPSCTPVNTPMNGALSTKYKNETHGSHANPKPGKFNFSWDGQSCVDTDVEAIKARLAKAEVFFFWEARFNGKWEDNDKTPRPQRKGWPDSKLIDSVIALHKSKGKTSLPKRWLYKSHSENKGTGDGRAEKPVLICPVKAKEVLLRCKNGQVVQSLKYYGTYTDGRFRYYGQEWGYEIANKAVRIQSSPLVDVVANGKVVGVVNAAFRDGEFR